MTSSADNSSSSSVRLKLWITVWLIFLAVVFGFGWYKAKEGLAIKEWSVRQAELSEEGASEWRRLHKYLGSLHTRPGSQKTLEDEWNEGQSFGPQALSGHNANGGRIQSVEWSHPKHGKMFTLHFDSGVLTGWGGGWGGQPESLNPRPFLLGQSSRAEKLRQSIIRPVVYAWCITIFAWLWLDRPWKLRMALAGLAAALICGTAWAVNPHYSVTWSGIFSNDRLFFAAFMIAESVILLARTLAKMPEFVESVRPRFGLRHLLFAITVLAILLAAGPFGYLTLAVGLVGAALFAAVYFLSLAHRRAMARWFAERSYS